MSRGTCSPEQMAVCPFKNHYSDLHHNMYPKSNYKTDVEKQYRELPENKEQLCRHEHEQRHATEPIPEKPSREQMLEAIARYMVNETLVNN